MSHTIPADKVAAYITESSRALDAANQQLSKSAQAERELQLRAPGIAEMLLQQGLISPSEKQAAIQKLSDPASCQSVLANLLAHQQKQASAAAVTTVGRGVQEKAASAYGIKTASDGMGVGLGSGSLFDPVVCGQARSMNDPVVRRRSDAMLKLAGINH